MSEFLHMGGYAAFVWSSYALAFILMGGMLIISSSAHKNMLKSIQGRLVREKQLQQQREREQKEFDSE